MNVLVVVMVNGNFENLEMPKEMIGELAEKLRTEGKTTIRLMERSIEVEGMVVLAKQQPILQ